MQNANVYTQNIASPPANWEGLSPGGHFENVWDMYGNSYRLSEILIDTVNGITSHKLIVNSQCGNSSYFDLYYEDGSGMEDLINPIHIDRRAVIEQVFCDLSQFIIPVNPNTKVKIWLRNIGNIPNVPSNVLGLATSFYSVPTAAQKSGIVDNEIWKTINSGKDSYTNVVSPLTTLGTASPIAFYHGMIALNFSYNWHLDLNTPANANSIDLYTVALHEISHALGFASLINDLGESRLSNGGSYYKHYYSRYDKFLMAQTPSQQPLITNSGGCSTYNYTFNPSLSQNVLHPNPTNPNCSPSADFLTNCSTAIIYSGSTTETAYTPDCWQSGSSLSHFEDYCLTPPQNDAYFVMSNASNWGSTKRHFTDSERKVFCDLGYHVGNIYGLIGGAYFGIYHFYGNLSTVCPGLGVAGVNDGINANGTYTYQVTAGNSIYFLAGGILQNDHNATSYECLESVYGLGNITSGSSGNITTGITYQVPMGSYGVDVLRYVPTNGPNKGNITYIYVKIISPWCGINSACGIVSNGGFENSINCGQYIIDDPSITCWERIVGSPDLFARNCSTASAPNLTIPIVGQNGNEDTWDYYNANNNHFVAIWGQGYNNSYFFTEALQSALSTTLYPGNYRLRCWVRSYSSYIGSNTPAKIEFGGFESNLFLAPLSGQNFTSAALGSSYHHLLTISAPTSPNSGIGWQYVDEPFTYSGPPLNLLTVVNAIYPNWQGKVSYALLDDISIEQDNNAPTLNLPTQICFNSSIQDLAQYANPQGGTFMLSNGVSLVGNQYNFYPPGIGSFPISYSYVDGSNCTHTVSTSVYVTNTCLPDIAVQKVFAGVNPFSVGDNVDFAITVTNNGPTMAHNIQILEQLPSCLSYFNANITGAGTYNPASGVLSIPQLSAGQSVVLSITAIAVGCGGNCTNCAELISLNETDSDNTNDMGCVDIEISPISPTILITGPVNSSNLWASGQVIAGQVIEVAGELTINSPVVFDDCEFNMQKGAKITVVGKGLVLQNNTRLYACEDMWWGIEVAADGILTATNSTIEDAQWGVWINDKSVATIDQCTFQQNFVGIFIPQSPLGYNNPNATITRCIFDGYTPLQSASPFMGQTPLPLQRALVGIWTHDVALNLPGHNFRGLCNGIIASRCNLSVGKCSFTDILDHSPYGAGYPVMKTTYFPSGITPYQNYNGTGIIQWGAHGAFSLKQTGFGSSPTSPLSFDNCLRGIAAFYTHLFATANNMDRVAIGVFLNVPTNLQTHISDNRIACSRTGIVAQMTDFGSSTTIDHNTISLHQPWGSIVGAAGIRVDNFATAANTTVNNNHISLSRAYRGIYVSNADKIQINRNQVYLNSVYNLDGIYLESTDNAFVMCDTVRGPSTEAANAIHLFNSVGNLISCNKTHNSLRGFYFRGDCTSDNNFRGNRIHNHNTGLQIGNSGLASKIGTQSHRGNRWQPQGGFAYANSAWCVFPSPPANSYFIVHTAAGTQWHPTGVNPSGWFQPQIGVSPFNNCGSSGSVTGDCAGGISILADIVTDSDEQVAEGLDTNIPFGEELKYKAETDLYEKLDRNPGLIPATGEIYDFYAAREGTTADGFSNINQAHDKLGDAYIADQLAQNDNQVQTWLGHIAMRDSLTQTLTDSLALSGIQTERDSLNTLIHNTLLLSRALAASAANAKESGSQAIRQENQSIVDSLLIAANEAAINEIFYGTIAQDNFGFSQDQLQSITDIAFQCPISGGEGVFKARALYNFIWGDTLYDDSTLCAAQGMVWRKANTAFSVNKNLLDILPNPATQTVRLSFGEDLAAATNILFTNQLGVTVKKVQSEKAGKSLTVSVADLPPGVYHVSMIAGGRVLTGKLIVTH